MKKLPDVMGLVLCEGVQADAALPSLSLEHVLVSLQSSVFPPRLIRMSAYVALFDGRGEGEMRVTCTRLETERDIHYYSKWCSFPVPGRITTLEFPMRKLKFPAPGRYAFALSYDRHPLTTSFLDVTRG